MAKKNDAIESMPAVKNKKRVWLLFALSTIGLCLLAGGAYFYLTQNTIIETSGESVASGESGESGESDASNSPEKSEAIESSVIQSKSSEFFNSKSEPEIGDLIFYELEENIITVLAETDYEMRVRLALFTFYGSSMVDAIIEQEAELNIQLRRKLSEVSEDEFISRDFRVTIENELSITANEFFSGKDIFAGIDSILFTEFSVN
ncbi:flagellar basal body-associated FliL family protein [Gammaproteobacteria bacterium]|nr:flagellar basal body-associated FliL family protein [Gammaproteobacteria bacterium]